MPLSFEEVADATVQVVCGGQSRGFRLSPVFNGFRRNEPTRFGWRRRGPITVTTEGGETVSASVVTSSSPSDKDFALLHLGTPLTGKRVVLEPERGTPSRGTDVVFAGFPHGISDLLVQRAAVAGPYGALGFHIDGSVNGGNSGGPVVALESGRVVGIVTQRRFFGERQLNELAKASVDLREHVRLVRIGGGAVVMMGINFMEFAGAIGDAQSLLAEVLTLNSSVGIGMAYNIDWALDAWTAAGLPT